MALHLALALLLGGGEAGADGEGRAGETGDREFRNILHRFHPFP